MGMSTYSCWFTSCFRWLRHPPDVFFQTPQLSIPRRAQQDTSSAHWVLSYHYLGHKMRWRTRPSAKCGAHDGTNV